MTRTILHQSDFFEVVSIEWSRDAEHVPHNHGWSQCMVLVEDGTFENTLLMGINSEVQVAEKGQVVNTPVGAQHDMKCLSATGKTLHVYTPKIQTLSEDGKFKISSLASLQDDLKLSQSTKMDQLRSILKSVQDHSITTQSPYFMNQLFSGVLPQMLLAEDFIAKTKTTMATFEASPALSHVESQVIHSLCELIGWRADQHDGVAVPGGSAANFMAIHCARQKKFPNFKRTGLDGKRLNIFVSSEAHYSFKKACAALGLGTDNLVAVPVDSKGRMIPAKLDELMTQSIQAGSTPLMVSATAGTTVLGAFDPIDQLAEVCKKHQVWLHVDAAWGGPALFSKQTRSLVKGAELADSWTFDAHKLFGASLTCSFMLSKHKGILLEANDVSGGDYLFHSDDPSADRGKASWQCGRRADAVSFWTIWKSVGTEGLGKFVDNLIAVRKQTEAWLLDQPRLEVVAEPDYLNLCVRVKAPVGQSNAKDWSKHVREELKDKNLAMVNYSADEQGPFLRIILAHPYLQFSHVKQILEWSLAVGTNN